MGVSIQTSAARRYETEVARLRWEDEQKRAKIVCLTKKNSYLEGQIAYLETVAEKQEAAQLQASGEMRSRSVKMCGSMFAGHEKMVLKNCFGAWRDYALHEVQMLTLQEEVRKKDRELREKGDRLKAQRIKISSLEAEMGEVSSALQAEKEKYASARDHHALMAAEARRAKQLAEKERAREMANLEMSAMDAATHLGIRIPKNLLLAQEADLGKAVIGTQSSAMESEEAAPTKANCEEWGPEVKAKVVQAAVRAAVFAPLGANGGEAGAQEKAEAVKSAVRAAVFPT